MAVKTHRTTFHQSPGLTGGRSESHRLNQRQQADLPLFNQFGINFLGDYFLGQLSFGESAAKIIGGGLCLGVAVKLPHNTAG